MQPSVTLTLTADEINLVLRGLGKLPFEESASVWSMIKTDAEAQINNQNDDEDSEDGC